MIQYVTLTPIIRGKCSGTGKHQHLKDALKSLDICRKIFVYRNTLATRKMCGVVVQLSMMLLILFMIADYI